MERLKENFKKSGEKYLYVLFKLNHNNIVAKTVQSLKAYNIYKARNRLSLYLLQNKAKRV